MQDKSRRKLIIIFLLVLLLHILLFLFLFFIPMHQRFSMPPIRPESLQQEQQTPAPPDNKQNQPEERKEEAKEWASLKPSASSFGAPVIMYDEPDDADLPVIKEDVQQEHSDQSQETEQQGTGEIDEAQEEKKAPQETEPTKETTQPETSQALQELIDSLDTSKALPVADNEQAKTPVKTPSRRRTRKKRTIKKKTRAQNGKNITLADITQGFLEQWKDKGPNLVRMYGNDNAAPTEEQIRYERYAARILWCLQNAWNIKLSQAPTQVPLESDMHICMVISKEGKLDNVNIVRSCGRPDIDRFMVDTILYAGSSFPPLPGFIKEVPFYMPWIIKIQLGTSGSHASRPRFSMH